MSDLYTEIINTTRALIIVLDTAGRIVNFNPACERVTGYRFEEVKGAPIWDLLLVPEEVDGVKATFEKIRTENVPNTHENHWITKSGERRFIEWSNSAVTDETGRVVHVIGTGIDVTEKRAAEQTLREAKQRTQALLDSMPDAAWCKDLNGVYIEVNRVFAERSNRDARDIVGKNDLELFGPEMARYQLETEQEVLRTVQTMHSEHRRMVAGQEYWLDTIEAPVVDETGVVVGTAGTTRDITERKRAEALRLARDATLRAALVKEVHHRIKNSLQGAIALIQELGASHPENADLVEAVVARVNTIASVHGLFGTIGGSDLRLEQIILTLVSSLKVIHADLPVRLSIRNEPRSVRVMESEVVPLALVVNELIMNAVKHSRSTADRDPVEIALEGAGDCTRIVVRSHTGKFPTQFDFDTGVGLGTGLSLVKSLLPRAGAALLFENAAGAAGAKVELTLRPPVIVLPDAGN